MKRRWLRTLFLIPGALGVALLAPPEARAEVPHSPSRSLIEGQSPPAALGERTRPPSDWARAAELQPRPEAVAVDPAVALPQAGSELAQTAPDADGPAAEGFAPVRQVDRVVVVKSERRLYLFDGPLLMRSYAVALGFSPEGAKRVQGDGKTPEGAYILDSRKPDSDYHRALHVSYPSARDRARAAAVGRSPGGAIMIHGLPEGLEDIGQDHTTADWTNGCIAVTNEQIEELWSLIDDGTPIHILP